MNIELRKTLWAAADKLRSSMDAAEYKHLVLGLIFVKYISDAFDELRSGLRVALADPESELYLDDPVVRAAAEEDRDYYTAANVFWVPEQARWENLRAHAKQANIGHRIDAALDAIEADNPRLKGILDKRFGRAQLEPGKLGELVDLVSTIGFGAGDKAKDVLGEVYEYFLGQFASAEGKKGGQFYTPASVVNGQGQPSQVADALGHAVTLTYQGNDLRGVTDALGHTTTFAVDPLGRVTALHDALGDTVQRSYDSNGWLKTVTDPRGQTTTLAYDHEGHIQSVMLPSTASIAYQYSPRYWVKQRTDALGQSEHWTYDGDGNIATYIDRKNQTTTYAPRDALGRFAQVTYADGSTVTANTYDAGNRLLKFTDSASGAILRSYDSLDRLTGESGSQGAITYTYYANGLRKTMTPAAQAVVNYTYNNDNLVKSITQGSETVGFGYDAANRRTTLTLPNGIVGTYGYDSANELTGITYKTATNTAVGNLGYAYDNAGRRLTQTGTLASDLLTPATTANGSFDLNNRQTAFNGQALTHDANGNLTGDGTNTYVWNARNQLMQIKQGTTVTSSFSYDANGRRIAKTIGGLTTAFLYDGANAVQESQGTVVNPILTGLGVDERFARNEGATRSYFLTDALGSTVALANAGGSLIQQYQYDPYGNVSTTGGATNPYQFTGRENDGTGLYYYRARYYSPGMGRFIGEDSMGFAGGQNNFYAYAGNAPVSYTDPQGKEFITDAIGAIAGGIAGYEAGGWRGAVVGGVVGGAVGFFAPQLSAAAATWAGGGIAGMFAATGTTVAAGAFTGAIATVGGNELNNLTNPSCKKQLADGLGFGVTLGAMAPLMSGEAFAAGAGEAAVGGTASNVFSGITGGINAIGEAFDPGAAHGFLPSGASSECGCQK